ncbi:hypothetical protein STEG23_017347, partial [Scotinomys teguina]
MQHQPYTLTRATECPIDDNVPVSTGGLAVLGEDIRLRPQSPAGMVLTVSILGFSVEDGNQSAHRSVLLCIDENVCGNKI